MAVPAVAARGVAFFAFIRRTLTWTEEKRAFASEEKIPTDGKKTPRLEADE